ncbi:hypothetical protein A4A49_60699 [Nicotiana attenuata]|uniref:Uncharacterized protein n=1 Tax=Nicotiana attenuata TaxID=49451 RepID=A0A1J6HVJ8_NICAT|nr:hypothetical protein A4A49_60699 [Nicotiana attenuata]
MAEDEILDGEEGPEVSSQQVGEVSTTQQDVSSSGEASEVPASMVDLNIASPTGNAPHAYTVSTLLGVSKREAIENMLLIATDGGLVGEYECGDVTVGS